MKLSPREAIGYFRKPDPNRAGLLIYGADAMRVAIKRQEFISALLGPGADEEMRLTRIPASDLRKDAAMLSDAVKAQGFFPGPRAAFVEDATDTIAKTIQAALADWAPGDAQIIVTAGQLNARSALRKLFEGDKNTFAAGIYDDPPSREEIESALKAAGLDQIDAAAMTDIQALSRVLDPGDFRQTIEKLGLYKRGDATPVVGADVVAVAPTSTEAALDDILNIVAEARTSEIGPIMQKLTAQGVQPVGLCIGAVRHFRTLHAAAADPGGPGSGIARVRPPVFGPRRDRMVKQAQAWGMRRLEQALHVLMETDLSLRSEGQTAPQMAVVERALIRLSMLGRS